MPRWDFKGELDEFFEDEEDFNVDDNYEGFEKIKRNKKFEEEIKPSKKKSSTKHQKRPDKD